MVGVGGKVSVGAMVSVGGIVAVGVGVAVDVAMLVFVAMGVIVLLLDSVGTISDISVGGWQADRKTASKTTAMND